MTTLYLVRHSEPLRNVINEYKANEVQQTRNEKNPLSVEGEHKAEKLSTVEELSNIDIIYSSNYTRAMSTAKYIAYKNNLLLNVDERLGERKFGVKDIKELPLTYFEDQYRDWNYKLTNGESLNDTKIRMCESIKEILDLNKDKKIVVVSHSTAINTFLSKYCDLRLNEEVKSVEIYFNNKMIFDGKWDAPELFKLEFDNENLINIENIKY